VEVHLPLGLPVDVDALHRQRNRAVKRLPSRFHAASTDRRSRFSHCLGRTIKASRTGMRFVTSALDRFRRVPYGFWAQFLAACIVAFFLERAADWLVEKDAHETSQVAQSVFDVGKVYEGLVTAGPRSSISRYTTIVEIDPDPFKDPLAVGYTSLCRQRAFIASLLEAVAKANPAVIVLDKYFDSSKCTGDEKEREDTDKLKRALCLLAPQVPVVWGVDATPSEGPSRGAETILVPPCAASLFHLAVVNLDRDTRRLPLHWTKASKDVKQRTIDGWSLALQTAQQFDPNILNKNRRLNTMVNRAENPYIGFLKTDQFTALYASEVLCLSEDHKKDDQCNKLPPRTARLRDLSHQIVVIGERTEREDNHNSIIGEVPGFYLQANYIEALLDNRLFRPVHPLINYALGLLIFAAFEYILISYSKKWWLALILIVILLLVTVLVLYLAVVHLGYYLNPATVSLVAIGIALGHLVISRFEGHGESETEVSHHEAS
jgi:CHASE2 domain-containing sensor protein